MSAEPPARPAALRRGRYSFRPSIFSRSPLELPQVPHITKKLLFLSSAEHRPFAFSVLGSAKGPEGCT